MGCSNAQCVYCSFASNLLSALGCHCSLEFSHPSGIHVELDRSDHLVSVGLRAKPSPVLVSEPFSPCPILAPTAVGIPVALLNSHSPPMLPQLLGSFPGTYRIRVSLYVHCFPSLLHPVTLPIYHKPVHNSASELSNISRKKKTPKLVYFSFLIELNPAGKPYWTHRQPWFCGSQDCA